MTKKKRKKAPKTLLGVDYGEKNIGIALGKNELVFPLRSVPAKNEAHAVQEITRVALQNHVHKFVVGLPLNYDGKETQESRKVRKFAKLLKVSSKKPVTFQEETGSSQEALLTAIELGIPPKKRSANDHLAAGIILKRYYRERKD
jgi:putative Holliday junction resolvase